MTEGRGASDAAASVRREATEVLRPPSPTAQICVSDERSEEQITSEWLSTQAEVPVDNRLRARKES